jgi:NSS family neurotransmitter:Na+ symporter
LMVVLLGYAINSGSFAEGAAFMFTPNFAALTWDGVLIAMGQAFFTLSIGMGAIMAYGAYLPEETSITTASTAVVVADTGIAILAGLVVFPLVFANGLDPAEGPGLVFVTLPLAFGQMSGGLFFATIFFILLTFTAWTSALGLIEPAVAWIMETYNKSRRRSAFIVGGLIWFLGMGSVLSFSELSDVYFLRGTIYQNIEYLTSNVMLPLSGILIAIFAAWIMCRNSTSEELGGAGTIYKIWRFSARFIAPIAIGFIFLQAIGVL